MVTDIEKLARELIALPSVNPAFLPKNDPDAGEMRVSDFLAATAAKAGLEVDLQEVLPGRRNVLARLTPPGKIKQRILLAPHTDTVTVVSPGQFTPSLLHGRIYGRGACDTKGSVAAMLGALIALARNGARPATRPIRSNCRWRGARDKRPSALRCASCSGRARRAGRGNR